VPKKRSPIAAALLLVLPLILLLGTVSCSSGAKQLPSLVFFQSDVCPYCREMKPLVDQIRSANRGQLKVVYATLEDPEGKELERARSSLTNTASWDFRLSCSWTPRARGPTCCAAWCRSRRWKRQSRT